MIHRGHALKVTIHLNDDTSAGESFLYQQVFDLLYEHGLAGATLSKLQGGFGGRHQLHDRDGQGVTRRHLPVRIEFIDSPEKVEAILPELIRIVSDGLIEMQETTIVKATQREESL